MTKRARNNGVANTNRGRHSSLDATAAPRRDRLSADTAGRRENVRLSLMLGTALGAGILAAAFVGPQPAWASTATCVGTTNVVCSGPSSNTIIETDPLVQDLTLAVGTGTNGADFGSGSSGGDAVDYTADAPGLTLTLGTNTGVVIGNTSSTSPYYVQRDGLHVYSSYDNTTLDITNAATIVSHRDAIYAKIRYYGDTEGAATISVTNTGQLGSGSQTGTLSTEVPTGFVGGDGIYTSAYVNSNGSSDPTVHNTIVNSVPIFSFGDAIDAPATAIAGYNGTAKAYSSVTNSGFLFSLLGDGIRTPATAITSGKSGTAYASSYTKNSATIIADHHGIYGSAYAKDDTGLFIGAAVGGSAKSVTNIINSGAIYSFNNEAILGTADAYANASAFIGTATGGTASAGVTIANTGNLTSAHSEGIEGRSKAEANALAFTATGGTANATTSITNTGGTIISNGHIAIAGYANAYANGTGNTLGYYNGKTKTFVPGVGTGGKANATVTITNTGNIGSVYSSKAKFTTGYSSVGIYGNSYADAHGRGFNAQGGTAGATTTITNSGILLTTGDDIYGKAYAKAGANTTGDVFTYYNGTTHKTYTGTATGGTANAGVTITNSGALTSTGSNGIDGFSHAKAGASDYTAQGGKAYAITTIGNTGILNTFGDGIFGEAYGFANAGGSSAAKGTGTGGTAGATVTINNTGGSITSKDGDGIVGETFADANGSGHTGTGGTATAKASTTIYNTVTITSLGDSIYGGATANANGFGKGTKGTGNGGHAYAYTTITNKGTLTSTGFEGIDGESRAYAYGKGFYAFGGTAKATTAITNSGAITSKDENGIIGVSLAEANAQGYTAKGGTATAYTHIVNSGPGAITSYDIGIAGVAVSEANAYGSTSAKGSGTGGTANSTVLITNSGTIASKYALGYGGITGLTVAEANGNGYAGKGGTATAYTHIVNSATITSYYSSNIYGGAKAYAHGYGSFAAKGTGTGGTATATVVISNTGPLSNGASNYYNTAGIVGNSYSNANARGYTANAGKATSSTTIYNNATIFSYGGGFGDYAYRADGIDGTAESFAKAYGGSGLKATGTGGTASSTVTITNKGAIDAPNGNGIYGRTYANASGYGFTAQGGTATAYTHIVNSGAIKSDDGIDGFATAIANGGYFFGYSFKAEPGKGTGGTATATVLITNSAPINATYGGGYFGGRGIFGYAHAEANGYGTIAVGGKATASTTIINSGRIFSNGDGVEGGAVSEADAFGSNGIKGSAKGGTATSTVTITNSANITSFYGDGVDAFAEAFASAYGHNAIAGTANANLVINLTGTNSIVSYNRGVDLFTEAEARGIGFGGIGGNVSATTNFTNVSTIRTTGDYAAGVYVRTSTDADGTYQGGTASSTTNVTNGNLSIHTIGSDSPGIAAYSFSDASGSYAGYAGYAKSVTIVVNNGTITTAGSDSPGIRAGSEAYAFGYTSKVAHSGTASASTTVTNAGAIGTYNFDSPGIDAYSTATAGSATTGYAHAVTSVSTSTTSIILTTGEFSPGIRAYSNAYSGGTAVASTSVNNAGSIVTRGNYSDGIDASSFAGGRYYYGSAATTASATTTVTNSGSIKTYGNGSYGIDAFSAAVGYTTANANTTVTNSGAIHTYGNYSTGIFAYAGARSDVSASVTVTNSGTITTTGYYSPGVYAEAAATSVTGAPTATILVTNSGTIHTYGNYSYAVLARVVSGGVSSSITINNTKTGSIVAGGFPYTAISAFGAPVTVNNAGYISGNMQLNTHLIFADVLNNSGKWVMQGNSNFGRANTGVINNTGTVTMVTAGSTPMASTDLATFGTIFSTVTVTGLANFNNTGGGLVSMTAPNERIILTGNFNGTPGTGAVTSTLAVDAFLGGPGSASDVLQVGLAPGLGNVTGTTNLLVTDTNPGLGAFNPIGIPVVESGGAQNIATSTNVAGNFVLVAPVVGGFPTIQKGLFDYNLFFTPAGAAGDPCTVGFNCWFLASSPSQQANELPRLLTAAGDVWSLAAGTWADRSADLRDALLAPAAPPPAFVKGPQPVAAAPYGGLNPGVWARAFGDWSHSGGVSSTTVFGQTLTHDVAYDQNTAGVQVGADFAANTVGYQTTLFGVMGGGVDSTVRFNSGSKADMQGGNGGVYATFLNRNFFADALFLANVMTADITSRGLGLTDLRSQVTTYGGHFDTGYRFNMPSNWFLEPLATLEIYHSQFDNLHIQGTDVALDDSTVRGRLGGRIGANFLQGSYILTPSITGGVWHAFTGNNFATLTGNGFNNFQITDVNSHKTYEEVGGALSVVQVGGHWSGFIKGDLQFANQYNGGSIKGGVRYQW